DGSSVDVKNSTTGTNWSLEPKSADVHAGSGVSGGFTYNNMPYVMYISGEYHYSSHWNGTAWISASTGITGHRYSPPYHYYHYGADAIYYDGLWNLVCGDPVLHPLRHFTGSFPSTWSVVQELEVGGGATAQWYPGLAILNGTLHCTYRNYGSDLHWQTYDGAAWTDKGDIELDIGVSCTMVKDPVNQQLVCVYVNGAGDLVYRTTDNLTAWSDNHTILSKGSYTIRNPHVEFIDSRLVVSFSYNLRGNYNIYTISAPDYSGRISGLNYTLNRIQWPDAAPDDTHVNSTVFSLKNINNRNITTITWHFEDIGEITAADNFKVWTNMSGAWSNLSTCDVSGNVTTLDI
ncbi:unnamed protein product, partial [marine sediment metagenome]